MSQPIWQKSGPPPADWLLRFTVGEDYRWDTLLLPYDIEGTRAHVWALGEIGILTAKEVSSISDVLDEIKADAPTVSPHDEDAHTVIERELTVRLGDLGLKIHAGRSRNDQVLVALRLWLRDQLAQVRKQAIQLASALIDLGEEQVDVLMPGYTHFWQAMPSSAGLWALGYAELLIGDIRSLVHTAEEANQSPWGSAAGYGIPHLDLPREAVAERLGFTGIQEHVTAVQLSRGKLEASILHALVQIGLTINRLSSDVILFSSAEFGFLTIPEEATTGSSIMPQKRNPDVFELGRATVHRLISELHLLLTLPANLPSGYHRDLQLTKEVVMRGVLTMKDLLSAMNHAVPGLKFNAEACQNACSRDLFATDAALRQVVNDGRPFREAYRDVGLHLDQVDIPENPLSAYKTTGTPGSLNPERLRKEVGKLKLIAT